MMDDDRSDYSDRRQNVPNMKHESEALIECSIEIASM